MNPAESASDLVRRHIEGVLDEAGRRELERLLESDPEARRIYVREMKLHGALQVKLKGVGKAVPLDEEASSAPARRRLAPTTRRRLAMRSPGPSFTWLFAVAASFLLVALLFFFASDSPPVAPPARADREVRAPQPEPAPPEPVPPLPRKAIPPALVKSAPPPGPKEQSEPDTQAEELRRKAEEAFAKGRTPAAPPAPPAPKPESLPSARPNPRDTAPRQTRPAVARVERIAGQVAVWDAKTSSPLEASQDLLSGEGVETRDKGARAVVEFADGTKMTVEALSLVRSVERAPGKTVTLERGAIEATVGRQPADRPMVFLTPHGEATVLGTTLRILVDDEKMRLEVEEGRVRLKRKVDGKTVLVTSGHYAVAAAGVELRAKRLPIREILIAARTGKVEGAEWRFAQDEDAVRGAALQSVPNIDRFRNPPQSITRVPRVTFVFRAEADLDYFVWVRGRMPAPEYTSGSDMVLLEFPGATVTEPPSNVKGLVSGTNRALINGWSHRKGYWWVGGDADGMENGTPQDRVPVKVRFARSGSQMVRMVAYESPVRIDAIWLSASQSERPPNESRGPDR